MDTLRDGEDELLTPAEVADVFRVSAKTVTRWARMGRITAIRTLGGHRRFRLSEVQRAFDEMMTVQTVASNGTHLSVVPEPEAPAIADLDLAGVEVETNTSIILRNAMAYLHNGAAR